MKVLRIFKNKKQTSILKGYKGQHYEIDNKIWLITEDLHRHDGHFLFIKRENGTSIIMQEVLFEKERLR